MTEQELKQGTPTDPAEESEPQPSTDERLSEIFSAFEEYGAAGATESHTCLFRLTGDAGGDYLLTTADGKATVKKDGSSDADITVTLPAEDLVSDDDDAGTWTGRGPHRRRTSRKDPAASRAAMSAVNRSLQSPSCV